MNVNFREDIRKAVSVLQTGGVILYPTDTIWGIGCDATDEVAVQRIYTLKKRIDTKSMLVLVDDIKKIKNYVEELPSDVYNLINNTSRPLTVIFVKAKNLAKNLPGKDGSIGIRVTKEKFSKTLIRRLGKPIVSTSANISGTAFPANFKEIVPEIIVQTDYVVKYRQYEVKRNNPSKIIQLFSDGSKQIIRE